MISPFILHFGSDSLVNLRFIATHRVPKFTIFSDLCVVACVIVMSANEEVSADQPCDLSLSMDLEGAHDYEVGQPLTASQDQLVDQVLAVDLGDMDQLLEVIRGGPNPSPEDQMRAHLMMVRQILDVQPDPARFM